jgi:hypothetical protein
MPKKNFFKFINKPLANLPEDLLVPGVGPFLNANIHVLDQFIKETKSDLKFLTCLLFNLVLF